MTIFTTILFFIFLLVKNNRVRVRERERERAIKVERVVQKLSQNDCKCQFSHPNNILFKKHLV